MKALLCYRRPTNKYRGNCGIKRSTGKQTDKEWILT